MFKVACPTSRSMNASPYAPPITKSAGTSATTATTVQPTISNRKIATIQVSAYRTAKDKAKKRAARGRHDQDGDTGAERDTQNVRARPRLETMQAT